MHHTKPWRRLVCATSLFFVGSLAHAAPLKVFILAGQSNMQGHARTSTFDYIGRDPKTAPMLKVMTYSQGDPVTCDKVWISHLSEGLNQEATLKEGRLTAGFVWFKGGTI